MPVFLGRKPNDIILNQRSEIFRFPISFITNEKKIQTFLDQSIINNMDLKKSFIYGKKFIGLLFEYIKIYKINSNNKLCKLSLPMKVKL